MIRSNEIDYLPIIYYRYTYNLSIWLEFINFTSMHQYCMEVVDKITL